MSDGADSTPAVSGPVEIIDHDLPCVHCRYNLRSLRISGRCPECGAPARHTLGEDWLRYDRPAHVRRLHGTLGRALIGFWVFNAGIVSALFLPVFMLAIPVIGGRPSPWSEILSFIPSAAVVLAGLLLILRFTSRIRVNEPLFEATTEPLVRQNLLKRRLVGVAFLAVLIAVCVGSLITIWAVSGRSMPIATQVIRAHVILLLASVFAVALWLHALASILRIAGIVKRCKAASDRQRRDTARALKQVTLDPPGLVLLTWVIWLYGLDATRDKPGMAMNLIAGILGLVVLIWWLTIFLLHRTRRLVASEIAAMKGEQ